MWRGDQNYTEDIAGKESNMDRSVKMALYSNTRQLNSPDARSVVPERQRDEEADPGRGQRRRHRHRGDLLHPPDHRPARGGRGEAV